MRETGLFYMGLELCRAPVGIILEIFAQEPRKKKAVFFKRSIRASVGLFSFFSGGDFWFCLGSFACVLHESGSNRAAV